MIQPIDGSKLLVLMIAGGVIAAVGLYLMLRPKPEDSAKIEIFGLKFESSSAGLVVFVIGAAFLAVPLFVPERTATATGGADTVRPPPEVSNRDPDASGEETQTMSDRSSAAPSPSSAPRAEQEPNDVIRSAETLVPGQTVTGDSESNRVDWFKLDVSSATRIVELRLRKNGTGRYVQFVLLNGREQEVERTRVEESTHFIELFPDQYSMYFLQVSAPFVGPTFYEVSIYEVGGN